MQTFKNDPLKDPSWDTHLQKIETAISLFRDNRTELDNLEVGTEDWEKTIPQLMNVLRTSDEKCQPELEKLKQLKQAAKRKKEEAEEQDRARIAKRKAVEDARRIAETSRANEEQARAAETATEDA